MIQFLFDAYLIFFMLHPQNEGIESNWRRGLLSSSLPQFSRAQRFAEVCKSTSIINVDDESPKHSHRGGLLPIPVPRLGLALAMAVIHKDDWKQSKPLFSCSCVFRDPPSCRCL